MTDPKDTATEDAEAVERRNLAMTKAALLGRTYDEIAREFSVSESTVKRVARKYGWRKLKRRIDQRQIRKVIADVVREQETDRALQDGGIQRDPASGKLFVEVDLIVPKGALKPGQPFGVIPLPATQAERVQTVLIDAEAGLVRTRYFL